MRQALLKSDKVAIGQIAFSGREHIFALTPAGTEGRGRLGYTLRYHNELRNQRTIQEIKEAEISEDSLELAEALIAKKTAKFDPSNFEDGHEAAIKELVDAKINHPAYFSADEIPRNRPANVVNLMDALKEPWLGRAHAQKPSMNEEYCPQRISVWCRHPLKPQCDASRPDCL